MEWIDGGLVVRFSCSGFYYCHDIIRMAEGEIKTDMFQNLKTKNSQQSIFKNSPPVTHSFSRSPGVSSSVTKHNEGDRLVRCRVCGFICDRERDVRIRDGSFAGLGVKFNAQQTAGASIGDAMVPAAGSVSRTPDKYYTRDVQGGCPSCGSYLYDEVPSPIPHLQ